MPAALTNHSGPLNVQKGLRVETEGVKCQLFPSQHHRHLRHRHHNPSKSPWDYKVGPENHAKTIIMINGGESSQPSQTCEEAMMRTVYIILQCKREETSHGSYPFSLSWDDQRKPDITNGGTSKLLFNIYLVDVLSIKSFALLYKQADKLSLSCFSFVFFFSCAKTWSPENQTILGHALLSLIVSVPYFFFSFLLSYLLFLKLKLKPLKQNYLCFWFLKGIAILGFVVLSLC